MIDSLIDSLEISENDNDIPVKFYHYIKSIILFLLFFIQLVFIFNALEKYRNMFAKSTIHFLLLTIRIVKLEKFLKFE